MASLHLPFDFCIPNAVSRTLRSMSRPNSAFRRKTPFLYIAIYSDTHTQGPPQLSMVPKGQMGLAKLPDPLHRACYLLCYL